MDDSDSDDNLGTSPQEGFSAAPARRARGGAATSPGRNPASNLRRVTHSAVEKRRREKLRERLEVLRSVVPSCSTQANLHKINVLDSAIEYICYMRRCMQKLVVERDAAYSAATAAAAAANNSASAASAAATAHMNISNQGCRECAQRAASRFPTRSSHPVMIHQVPSPASTPVAPTTTWQQVGPAHHAYAAGSPPSVQPMRSPSLAQQSPGQYSHAEQEQQQHYHTHHHHQHSHTHSQDVLTSANCFGRFGAHRPAAAIRLPTHIQPFAHPAGFD
ncbi:uncharacterized protein EV422DRAFT_505648 [Fimicolochytrium jonesii]|uniref:uncharacterized protein n=1 Tax=Fimicolochytrium jonesii TaxID=1396493 RepID=UPI0022FDE9BB|nr:uncharacterized protein EV422DRAFT_505648 [Fimicolochytrium jonesii]KAI8822152.1 hypothetical protein EV422DRAFT_505648 [Fimicolochytrium jonesii]